MPQTTAGARAGATPTPSHPADPRSATTLFYGVPEGCSFGAIVALAWSGQPYQLCRIPMPELVGSEAYRRINPLGETPSLMTADGRIFSQSQAILLHIAQTSDDPRMGGRPGTAAGDRQQEALSFLTTTFFSAFSPLWQAFEHAGTGDGALLRTMGERQVTKAHAQLERLMDGRDWLAGDGPTLADAYFIGIARWNDFHRVLDRRAHPQVHALHERLRQDPAVRFAHAVEDGAEAAPGADGSGGFRGHVGLDELLARLQGEHAQP